MTNCDEGEVKLFCDNDDDYNGGGGDKNESDDTDGGGGVKNGMAMLLCWLTYVLPHTLQKQLHRLQEIGVSAEAFHIQSRWTHVTQVFVCGDRCP